MTPVWTVGEHRCVVCGADFYLTADNHHFHILCGSACKAIYELNPLPYEVSGILFCMLPGTLRTLAERIQ